MTSRILRLPTVAAPARAGLALLLAAVVVSAAPRAAQAQAGGDGAMRGFLLSGDFQLVLDGKLVPKAEVYRSTRAAAVLVIAPGWESPVLLTPSRGGVDAVNLMKMSRVNVESIDLLPGAVYRSLGSFTMAGETIAFTAFGKPAKLEPRPWLLKNQSGAKLLEHDPNYARRATSYPVDAAILAELKKQAKPVRVLMFFGSWCPHCQMNLPKILKVEQELGGGNIQFDYYGLPKGSEFSKDPEVLKYKIDAVPTGIVLVDGREVGRLENAAWLKIEQALRDAIKKPA
jgi:thiol-disulfide isomerase/thioredoxin